MDTIKIQEERTIKRLETAIRHYHDKGRAYGELIGILVDEGHALTSPRVLELAEKVGNCTVGYNMMDTIYGNLLEQVSERRLHEDGVDELPLDWDG